MAEQTPLSTTAEVKYLDKKGLETLWARIKHVFPQTTHLGELLDNMNDAEGNLDPFTRKSYVDAEDTRIWTKLEQLEIATGSNYDNDTIVLNKDSKLSTNLILDLDRDKKTIRLITKDQASVNPDDPESYTVKTIVSEIDYTPFVRDSFLKNVSVVVIPDDDSPTGYEPGTYLKFVFNTQDENGHTVQEPPIYLSVDDLGFKLYRGSKYITIDAENDGYMSVKLNTVELKPLIEDYINTESATITAIRSDIRNLQSSVAEHGAKVTHLENVVINGYTDDGGNHVPSVLDKITSTNQTVQSLDGRVTTLETWVVEGIITSEDINDITNNLS